MALSLATLKTLLGLLKIAPAVQTGVRKWKGRPTEAERAHLVAWARRLDERRVFFADYNIEVVEACLASLDHVRQFTDEVLAEIEHPGARAMLGGILDSVRQFHDKWHGFRTPNHFDHWRPRPHRDGHGEDGDLANFFEDLGELRGRVRLLVGALCEIEPDVKAPTLLAQEVPERGEP